MSRSRTPTPSQIVRQTQLAGRSMARPAAQFASALNSVEARLREGGSHAGQPHQAVETWPSHTREVPKDSLAGAIGRYPDEASAPYDILLFNQLPRH
jgi:hypothetical protein